MAEKIIRTEYAEEMQKSYLDYSMSVITSRAIPDARDGLKPVQRRVLYDMSELRTTHDKPHKKSARIVGDAMGKYHPHGDSSIYETLVVMSQGWKKGMPLVDGHGNFGSIEGDGAAAMRYTEARLQKFTEEVYLKDLDKTVDFVPNYDGDTVEPAVLPVRIPNLLVNGADGIAVGMSTSIPPHNLGEVCDACIAYIKNRDITISQLLKIMPGPDFPTGGIVANKSELKAIYETGVGKIKLRGKVEVELGKKKSDKDKLVISEIPYTMIGAGIGKFLEDIAALVENKKLTDIVDISNQSDKDGMRIVLELKNGADVEKIKNTLYKKTKLEDTFGVNMLAIAHGRPETLDLKGILSNYLDFQYECQTKKYNVLLQKAIDKQEIEEGLIRACDVIDEIIKIIRSSKTRDQAKEKLMKNLKFTERQSQAILDLRLYKLIGLEIEALLAENKETKKNIKRYKEILKSKNVLDEVLITDLEQIKKEYAVHRRTRLEDAEEAVYEEAPIEEEEVVFIMDRFGYCKTIDRATYDRNAEAVETDFKYVVPIWNIDKLCVFTSAGNMHSIKVMDIPSGKLRDKGTPLDNICKFDSEKEEVLEVRSTAEMEEQSMLFVTAQGLIKTVPCSEFETSNRCVASTKLNPGDKLVAVIMIGMPTDVVLVSDADYALRFPLNEVTEMKKTSKGEKGMKLNKDESVVSAAIIGDVNTVKVRGRDVQVGRLKEGHRNGRGSKIRG